MSRSNIAKLYAAFQGLQSATKLGRHDAARRHREVCYRILNTMPHGSGMDARHDVEVRADRRGERIIVEGSYHRMNQNGFYDGWVPYVVTIRPGFNGVQVDVRVRGADIAEYIGDCFHMWASAEYTGTEVWGSLPGVDAEARLSFALAE